MLVEPFANKSSKNQWKRCWKARKIIEISDKPAISWNSFILRRALFLMEHIRYAN